MLGIGKQQALDATHNVIVINTHTMKSKRVIIAQIGSIAVATAGVIACARISDKIVQAGIYADEHQTSGAIAPSEILLLAASVFAIIFGATAFLVLLEKKGPMHFTAK